jgi:hypothetical protein
VKETFVAVTCWAQGEKHADADEMSVSTDLMKTKMERKE